MKKTDEQFWSEQMGVWKESDLSIKKFCRAEGLIESKFYYWKKRLQKSEFSSSDFIETCNNSEGKNRFTITLPNSMALSFDSLPEASWLGQVLKNLGDKDVTKS